MQSIGMATFAQSACNYTTASIQSRLKFRGRILPMRRPAKGDRRQFAIPYVACGVIKMPAAATFLSSILLAASACSCCRPFLETRRSR